jgi:hypothetical protein
MHIVIPIPTPDPTKPATLRLTLPVGVIRFSRYEAHSCFWIAATG